MFELNLILLTDGAPREQILYMLATGFTDSHWYLWYTWGKHTY